MLFLLSHSVGARSIKTIISYILNISISYLFLDLVFSIEIPGGSGCGQQTQEARTGWDTPGNKFGSIPGILSIYLHDLSRGPVLPQEPGHESHGAIDMLEKGLVSLAQIVQSSLPPGRLDEPVLGTPAMAGETNLALTAVTGQQVQFILAELVLFGRGNHFDHRDFIDVTQEMVRGNEVVAGIHIPGVFHGHRHPAGRCEYA